ncbi:MAG: DUF4445 domain-containing protein [Firmicutes bacterium]|nr:DUF4445 domain-containing protein [Bacillota bacterium]
MKIRFAGSENFIEVRSPIDVLTAAGLAGETIDGICAGNGSCGKCRVRQLEGKANPVTTQERSLLTEKEISEGYRLACMLLPETDVLIENAFHDINAGSKGEGVLLPGAFLKSLEAEQRAGYGMAFDIGTTTVAGILWDMKGGVCLGAASEDNPQRVHGADVISRINYIGKDGENLGQLHREIIGCMNGIIEKVTREAGISAGDIIAIAAAGNSCMSHILAGVKPYSLAIAPYTPLFTEAKRLVASELGLEAADEAELYLLPNIAGHVGSDISADIIATGIFSDRNVHLMIDVGTNGEIVLAANGKLYACSTAAGPAFEGASIKHGMRAAGGAIEKVEISEGNVLIKTIGDERPVGICGSGIIDAVSEMLKAGVITEEGRIKSADEIGDAFLAERIKQEGRTNRFILYADDESEVAITQKDIREIQLAKGAIYAGALVLADTAGLSFSDIEKLTIAGAFGSYIDVESAMNIGLLPEVERSKVKTAGNAAGTGASMALFSEKTRATLEEVVETVTHVDLSTNESFQSRFIDSMGFGVGKALGGVR